MNREIEFRGFDGTKWYYGDLEYNRKTDVARIHIYGEYGSYCRQYTVDPDTVGEFTGMKDRRGKKIFEGDIVDVFTSVVASKYRGVVQMYRGSWRVEYEGYGTGTVFHPMLFFDDLADKNTEVIGNIHNNPALLAEK